MKFIPRQPPPPPERSASRRTTRHLRLQSTEDAENEEAGEESTQALSFTQRPEPRSLPMPPETSSIQSSRTPSQRVLLRLDPEIATQPLPETQRPSYPASFEPAAEMPAPPLQEQEPIELTGIETVPPDDSEISSATPIEEQASPFVSESETADEPGAQDPTVNDSPDAFSQPIPDPVQPASSWALAAKRLTPPAQLAVPKTRTGASSAVSLSRMARGERPAARRRFAPREAPTVQTEADEQLPPSPASATESHPLPRPELRRPTPTPLAGMTRPDRSLGRGFWMVLILVLILLGMVLYFFGVVPRIAALLVQRAPSHAAAPARAVVYAVARRIMTPVELPLTGTIEPFQQTSLYARTTGYVRDWLVDLGDPVKAGQVLAELDTPDVDHQLTQARATADEAKARLTLAQDESKRWDAMAVAHAVSQQDADEKDSARDEAQAGLNAAQASVARLVDMELFKEIRAPYAGRITARNLEIGTLVANGPGAAGSELFRIAQTDPVRVFVDVPEASAPAIRAGLTARIEVPSFPDRVFSGTVVRDAGILDATTHMLRTELRVANPDGALLPGAQARVRLQLGDNAPVVLIPVDTLIAKRDGVSVARLTETAGHDIVHFTPVEVGRDFGMEVEVLDNVQEGDRLVSHPPPDLRDGAVVNARPFEQSPVPSLLPPKPSSPRA